MGRLRCKTCNTILESKHVHDFVACECKEATRVYLDGGHEYTRIMFPEGGRDKYLEMLPCDECNKKHSLNQEKEETDDV